jgi:hypothetical protein
MQRELGGLQVRPTFSAANSSTLLIERPPSRSETSAAHGRSPDRSFERNSHRDSGAGPAGPPMERASSRGVSRDGRAVTPGGKLPMATLIDNFEDLSVKPAAWATNLMERYNLSPDQRPSSRQSNRRI